MSLIRVIAPDSLLSAMRFVSLQKSKRGQLLKLDGSEKPDAGRTDCLRLLPRPLVGVCPDRHFIARDFSTRGCRWTIS